MTSNEHLEHLLEERRALLRQVARLEAVIAVEMMHAKDTRSQQVDASTRRDTISWEDALHEAKIRLPDDILALQN